MTICARLTAVSRMRACRADASSNCQNTPARASGKCPKMILNYLISMVFSAVRPALSRFFPVLSLLGRENARVRSARLVFDRAAIGAGRSDRDRLAGSDLIECCDEIVLGGLDVGEAGRRGVVDRAHVGDPAATIDYHHVRRRSRVVEVADDALRV